jgi:hypothetical protein
MKSEQVFEKGLWKVPLADVQVDDELRSAVDNVVESGWWSMGRARYADRPHRAPP